MSASAIFILDLKGKVLISRNYRGDINLNIIEKFMPLLSEMEEDGKLIPFVSMNEITFPFIKYNNLYLVSVTKKNANVGLIFVFLHKLAQIFVEYFRDLEEESIRDNFVVIYELLDELMDFGYPQTTDTKILQEYITQEGRKLEMTPRPPMAVTNAVSWRKEGIKYRKNEGGKEYLMRAHFGLPSVESEDIEGRAPIYVKFEIPYFTTSGIQVRYLKIIEKSGYQALPWVRYITQNGDYQIRTI
ncbi:unnamed protein product [Gordionus sp. m RMFG-2023]